MPSRPRRAGGSFRRLRPPPTARRGLPASQSAAGSQSLTPRRASPLVAEPMAPDPSVVMSGRALELDLDVGVVGAGAMGAGIALVAASAGHRVRLFDAAPGAADRGKARLAADLDRLVQRGKLAPEEAAARIGRIIPAPDLSELRGSALVIEAIIENLQAKAEVLGRLEALLPIEAVVASNTSSLSTTALASLLSRPARVLGMHFFNPAQLMPLVEVVS